MNPRALELRLKRHRKAALALRAASPRVKNAVLNDLAKLLVKESAKILKANRMDLQALSAESTPAFQDRLKLDPSRILQMAESLKQVARLPDPVGEEVEARRLANGIQIRRVRAPLGVILMIFESRPNVATEAFSLAFKSGNVVLLRGGRESRNTTRALYQLMEKALTRHQLSKDSFWGITDPDRTLVQALLKARRWIDIVVPRGGEKLIDFVVENSRIPIIKNDRGLCHVYVHADADLSMAEEIVFNAKTQRPGVCNSMETLLVNRRVASTLLPALHKRMKAKNLTWYGCRETLKILKGLGGVQPAKPSNFDTEYLDYQMNCRVVESLDEAIEHIERHGSKHSEAIVTRSRTAARRFQAEVDAAAAYWNASTRFTDGFELGLGGELGISTQKLHVRGPVGLKELTSERWILDGKGQVRK